MPGGGHFFRVAHRFGPRILEREPRPAFEKDDLLRLAELDHVHEARPHDLGCRRFKGSVVFDHLAVDDLEFALRRARRRGDSPVLVHVHKEDLRIGRRVQILAQLREHVGFFGYVDHADAVDENAVQIGMVRDIGRGSRPPGPKLRIRDIVLEMARRSLRPQPRRIVVGLRICLKIPIAAAVPGPIVEHLHTGVRCLENAGVVVVAHLDEVLIGRQVG